ncbi:MAG: hypothetical protein ABI878_04455 [Acidobacteriota bacterium]
MVAGITSGDRPEPEILGLQYAMYLQKPGEWFPNTGDSLNLDRKDKCKYVLNKAKMSGAVTILTPWTPYRSEANILINSFKKKRRVSDFIRIECYSSDTEGDTFGSARSGNFTFDNFAGLSIEGFKVTQHTILGTQMVKHGTAEVFTLESDRMGVY